SMLNVDQPTLAARQDESRSPRGARGRKVEVRLGRERPELATEAVRSMIVWGTAIRSAQALRSTVPPLLETGSRAVQRAVVMPSLNVTVVVSDLRAPPRGASDCRRGPMQDCVRARSPAPS